ncbi:MAG TPA: hypothetical protein VMD91_13610 [Candidatus Sulfotelmatobacter sp.]|nr:hypothetical protein [Candidatus Sulfotelmatobacter sp.]
MRRSDAIAGCAALAGSVLVARVPALAAGPTLASPRGGPLLHNAFAAALFTRAVIELPDDSNPRDAQRGSWAMGVAFDGAQVSLARTIALKFEPVLSGIDALLADDGPVALLAAAGDQVASGGDAARARFLSAAQNVQTAAATIAAALRAFRTNPIAGDYPYVLRIVTQLNDAVRPDGTMPALPRRYAPQAEQFQQEGAPLARQLSRWIQLCVTAGGGADVALAQLADILGGLDAKIRGLIRDASDANAPPRLVAVDWTVMKRYLLSIATGSTPLVDSTSWPATGGPVSVPSELGALYASALSQLTAGCTYLLGTPPATPPGTGNLATMFIVTEAVAGLLVSNVSSSSALAPNGQPLTSWLATRLRNDAAIVVNAGSAAGPALPDYRAALQRLLNYAAAYPHVFS